MSLTRRQSDLLAFINREIESGHTTPSFDEMRVALGLKSKSGIHRLVDALEERGFIRRLPHRARCIDLVENPSLHSARRLASFTNFTIAEEARRRGLALCERKEVYLGNGSVISIFAEVEAR